MPILNGCAFVALGGAAATGAAIVQDRRPKTLMANDERIEIKANLELNAYDSLRDKTHFNVTSFNGIVLLTGEAPNEQLRNKISSIVRIINGVKVIQDHIHVMKPTNYSSRSKDTMITTKVKSALLKSNKLPGFDSAHIKVLTENQRVYLMGLVYQPEAEAATEITRRVKGVKQVIKVFEYIE